MKNIIEFLFIFFFLFFSKISFADINIKFKIDKEIITNVDILNEKKYLLFIRPNLSKLSKKELIEIAKNSLIRETIKKREINRIYKDFENVSFIEQIKKNLFKFKNVKNEEEFTKLAENSGLIYENIIEKIKYEGLWNDLIYKKFNSLVKIDEKKLKKELIIKISNNKKFEYNLSEILFEIENNENLEDKLKTIKRFIFENDFRTAASKFSISSSAKMEGEIGWIKETLLSEELSDQLNKMKVYEITDPIKHPSGFLLIKINDKREIKENINLDKELSELINFERNRQLNQFSLLFYKKIKQNTIMYEK
tara:strand:- start:192 stop:1118 length:927 start_codon:yes stop_codon:yes gene_type:complete